MQKDPDVWDPPPPRSSPTRSLRTERDAEQVAPSWTRMPPRKAKEPVTRPLKPRQQNRKAPVPKVNRRIAKESAVDQVESSHDETPVDSFPRFRCGSMDLVEMIERDVMSRKPNVKWEDIADLEDVCHIIE
jgi:katanin p60 ATPase-containing subunit A1